MPGKKTALKPSRSGLQINDPRHSGFILRLATRRKVYGDLLISTKIRNEDFRLSRHAQEAEYHSFEKKTDLLRIVVIR